MNDKLAERLLAKIMDWDEITLSKERQDLQALSLLKYDEYQQFFPGKRFIESLSLWLKQFPTIEERRRAYEFVKQRIVFISQAELNHLIRITYPDIIEPYLINHFSKEHGISEYEIARIVHSERFSTLKRSCLFLGLSDGARIDILRRYAKLNHEQVYPIYSFPEDKSTEFVKKLQTSLTQKGVKVDQSKSLFKIVFLIDDFSGSGTSFFRKEGATWEGKIFKFFRHVRELREECRPVDLNNFRVCMILYVATSKAIRQIERQGKDAFQDLGIDFTVKAVQEISDDIRLHAGNIDDRLHNMLKKYYDEEIESPSYKKGSMDKPYLGFDQGGLPLVMAHNCPNNSVPLIWFDPDRYKYAGLFPRVERFVGE